MSLEETYKMIVTESVNLIGADYGSILLLQDNQLQRVYASSPVFYKIQPKKRDFMYRVLKSQKPVVLNVKQIVKNHPEIAQTHIKCDVIFPLINRQKPIGILTIMSLKDNFFTDEKINSLKALLPLAVLAIRKAELYNEADQSIQAKDLFISMAAHELRTPLTTIHGYAQLLNSKLAKTDSPEARWAAELSGESYRLTILVNELLETDRIRTGKFRYLWKECHLKEVVSQALMDFRFTHPENKVVLKNTMADGQGRVIGDHNKLLQVIINLLDNAAKFSPLDKEINITLDNKGGFVILQISDSGKGIAKKDLNKVYEMFYRGENHSREGMGLGLFLAKTIIINHHGAITIKSKENKGTTVEIKLPEHKS